MAGTHDRLLDLEEINPDGAIRESALAAQEAARDHTRASFFRRGGVLAGVGIALGAVPVGLTFAQGGLPKGDIDVLNYALTLEYLEAAFYQEALERGQLDGESLAFAQIVAAHEQAHVDALKQTLGDKAVQSPKFDFQGTTGKEKFLRTAQTLEDTGVAAYQGQAGNIKTDAVLAAAASILSVEARHAGWVRDIIGGGEGVNPAPDAFEKPSSKQEVLDIVESTGFIKG